MSAGQRLQKRSCEALLGLLLILLFSVSAGAETHSGKVSWIYDGDTIKVAGIGKVRLLGIDSPEKEDSPRDDYYLRRHQFSRDSLRRIAQLALKFNIRQLKGRRIELQFDREKTDRYGRTLAYVILPDGRMLNRLLLEQGLATVYRRFDFRLKKDFLRAEKTARDQKRGLWHK